MRFAVIVLLAATVSGLKIREEPAAEAAPEKVAAAEAAPAAPAKDGEEKKEAKKEAKAPEAKEPTGKEPEKVTEGPAKDGEEKKEAKKEGEAKEEKKGAKTPSKDAAVTEEKVEEAPTEKKEAKKEGEADGEGPPAEAKSAFAHCAYAVTNGKCTLVPGQGLCTKARTDANFMFKEGCTW